MAELVPAIHIFCLVGNVDDRHKGGLNEISSRSNSVAPCRVSRQSSGMLGASGRLSLAALVPLRARGAEVIVVDSGSNDSTPALARTFADRVISAPRNRGAAMNAGAALASGDVFLFLHADTIVPDNA